MVLHNRHVICFCMILMLIWGASFGAYAEVLPLGANHEFAIDTEEGWKYYTPNSDLSEVATTAGYLFRSSSKYVCYVVAGSNTAIIAYYSTDSNAGLQGRDKFVKCLEHGYSPTAEFFINSFLVFPINGGYIFNQKTELLGSTVEYYSSFIILEHGIIEISSNGSSDDQLFDFVYKLYFDIMTKKDNPIV